MVEGETLRVVEFPDPRDAWFFDQKGEVVREKVLTKAPITAYWNERKNIVAALLMIPTLVLILILLNETKIFSNAWDGVIGFFMSMLGMVK